MTTDSEINTQSDRDAKFLRNLAEHFTSDTPCGELDSLDTPCGDGTELGRLRAIAARLDKRAQQLCLAEAALRVIPCRLTASIVVGCADDIKKLPREDWCTRCGVLAQIDGDPS